MQSSQGSAPQVERERRKLLAILAADAVGYSRLMGRDEAGTLSRLKALRADCLEPALFRNDGRLIKHTGDGALVEFGSAVDALRAAVEFQQAVADANQGLPEDIRLLFRVGVHLGDVILDGDDRYGEGVNIAARLEAAAPAGGIVASNAVREAAEGRLKATLHDLGRLQLKNIERPVRSFRVDWSASDWPAHDAPAKPRWHCPSPYRGLLAMDENDSDFFFGRTRETVEVLKTLASRSDRAVVLLGNSGVGKSSLARAGVMAALKRQSWPEAAASDVGSWPSRFSESRRWRYLSLRPGDEPIEALVACFINAWHWKRGSADPERFKVSRDWVDKLRDRQATLTSLIEATDRYYDSIDADRLPAYLIYVDQGEELYIRAGVTARERFSELLAAAVSDPRLFVLISLRADLIGELQNDRHLYESHVQVNVPPLRQQQLEEITLRPVALLDARFESEGLANTIVQGTIDDAARGEGALPLLSYALDDMWSRMLERSDGVLRLPGTSFAPGAVLAERGDRFVAERPRDEPALRRILTLRLATVRESERPTRRRAPRSEFSETEWLLVSSLADYPYRLLSISSTEAGVAQAEVAHETLFDRWSTLKAWIASERQFLTWRGGLEAARRTWENTDGATKADALLMGAPLVQAESWIKARREDLIEPDRTFIDLSIARERNRRRRARRAQALIYALLTGIILVLGGATQQDRLAPHWYWYARQLPHKWSEFDPHLLGREAEKRLKPGDSFRECAKDCPEMVAVPPGSFSMGSPISEMGRFGNESPRQNIVLPRIFAVSRFEVTNNEWDACVAVHGCDAIADVRTFPSGNQPVVNVSWEDTRKYVTWLSRMTGKPYRLLSEAEWEYVARAGSAAAYSWGEEVRANGQAMANCDGCGSVHGGREPAPVGSFAANAFGLHDLHGNVWEWVEDCYADDLRAVTGDGAPRVMEGCSRRSGRGGAWDLPPRAVRSAVRSGSYPGTRSNALGFRVARTLEP